MMHPIVLGNDTLHVTINRHGQVDGFHFPLIGLYNHMSRPDTQHHLGVWVDGTMSWLMLSENDWDITMSYPYQAMIGVTRAVNKELGIMLEFNDTVDSEHAIFLRNIHVVNMRQEQREIRLFLHQAFTMDDLQSHADTAEYQSDLQAITHRRGNRTFIIGGQSNEADQFDQYSIGNFGAPGQEGTYRDADDGELSMNSYATGEVDSTLRFSLTIPAKDSRHVQYWIAAGNTQKEALKNHQCVQKHGVHARIQTALKYWHSWIQPIAKIIDQVDLSLRQDFIKSLLFIKLYTSRSGAILSASASEKELFYCHPYEATISLWPLIRLGYYDEPKRFFSFCRDALLPDGSLHSLLQADGAPGPERTPHKDTARYSNEAAAVLFMFSQFQQAHPNTDLLESFYESFVKKIAQFLLTTIDTRTSLPKSTATIWGGDEQIVSTHTTAVVYTALQAASEVAEAANDEDSAVAWRLAAIDMHTAAQKVFFDKKTKTLRRSTEQHDTTLDAAAIFSSFMFGLFDSNGKEVTLSVDAITELASRQPMVGLQAYYPPSDEALPRSTIATLWLAQYYVEKGATGRAKDILMAVRDTATSTAILSDTMSTNMTDSTSLSLWAHAEFASTILDMIARPKAP